ncbi:MAG TPA: hypothetical protein VM940_05400, partial [Chthoniobacterales bacterium]|nr:hypothetical protein [Chthoniobacterales bacterium]
QVEHLYIKQRSNELNFNGEFAWPEKSADWIKPAFHGDILASINDLGDFARLFGQTPADFGGKLSAKGHVSAEGGKLGGQLSVTGNSLIVLRSEIDSLELNLELKESQLAVTRLDLRRDVDFLRAEGTFALNNRGLWTGSLQTSVGDLANYRGFIPRVFARLEPAGGFEVTWKSAPDSGAVEIRSRNARLGAPATAAFEAAIDVEYSANTTFFRQLHVWNSRSDLRGFLTLANDYIHLQELRFDLNGRRCLEGDVFLPVSFQRLRGTGEWLASLTDDPFFDVNLKLEESDMAEIAAAVSAFPSMSGRAAGRLQLSGTPGSLQGNAVFQSRDLVTEASPAMRAALELRLALGIANLKADLAIGGSAVVVDAAFPLQLERTSSGHEFRKTGPISASIKFPALFLARLPRYLTREIFTRGILTGGVNIADTLEEPLITGNLNLIAAQVLGGPELSGAMTFKGREATIDFAHVERDDADILLRGQINFQNLEAIGITLLPNTVLAESPGLFQGDCVSKIELAAQPLERSAAAAIDQIKLRGNLFAQTWTISLSNGLAPDLPEGELGRVFSFCADGKTLTLGVQPSLFP